jgi:pre-mRNA-splicing factor SYF1
MGLFAAAKQSGKVGWIVSGSDNNNDFRGEKEGVHLAYARKSGFGGNTGDLLKGARILKVSVN